MTPADAYSRRYDAGVIGPPAVPAIPSVIASVYRFA